MTKKPPGFEHAAALEFVRALFDNDVDKFWSAISPESRAFLIGFWHGRVNDAIGPQQVKEPTLEDPMLRKAAESVVLEDHQNMVDAWGADFLETFGISTRDRHSEDGIRADVLFLPEHMTTVVYIVPTEVDTFRLPMLLSIDAIADGGVSLSWGVDYMRWFYR